MDKHLPESRQELQSLQGEWSAFGRRHLLLWLVRWTIGFAVIGTVVYFNPEWSWLWGAGLGAAALTPLAALAGHWFVQRKIRDAETVLGEVEATMRELDEG